MNVVQLTTGDVVAAMFSLDFVDGGFRREAVERIHRGAIDEWVSALTGSGLFSNRAVADVVRAWRDDPRVLLDSLLAEADPVTLERYRSAWYELDALVSYGVAA
ncbi:hypothetical protein ACVH9Z_11565 [Rhodococcus opacus]|uniref:Uncharacterized protein n=1 Tax=Rhodococcus opacus TaxID=37919 RepID=A0A1B1K1U5_RHOOP|nr:MULTISPECIES: hypothetical protein [Rhodococcus]ELB87983.1 hypothetical protein Rwratislav_36952 [Rhodococcus wratislaviensis IFP 2016]NHU46003.1 hypothetical protein [Rhodococcus sp. A14]ANS26581.1 hypothetical protein R1CP_09305 [Rhodococcus opacus]MBA8959457.1 hypothetical protein [Rhodococcus opacus]MBP2205022.1 hypothetical protein [Rhodococcus opacus]